MVRVFVIVVFLTMADREAGICRITLTPPAVQDRGIEHPVDSCFHTGGTAGLHAAAGSVQPDIHALDEVAGDLHVVVFQEKEAPFYPGAFGEFDDLPDEILAGVICRVGLACVDKLHRPRGVIDQCLKAGGVPQEQGGPLVAGGAPGKPDGQNFRIQHAAGIGQLRAGGIALGELFFQRLPGRADQPAASQLVRPPNLLVRDVIDPRQHFGIANALFPIRPDILLQQGQNLRSQPSGSMHPIGHMADRQLIPYLLWPHVLPHPARDIPVQLAHSIGKMGKTQPEDGHGKR